MFDHLSELEQADRQRMLEDFIRDGLNSCLTHKVGCRTCARSRFHLSGNRVYQDFHKSLEISPSANNIPHC
jgi:hypothetical protein